MDPEKVNYHYTGDLPTSPIPGIKVLVTGASGYVARRLTPELVSRGYFVRCMLRNRSFPALLTHSNLEYAYADGLNKEELRTAMQGIDVAFYLIHSMRLDSSKFRQTDKAVAKNFREVAEECGIKKIIYLGGLGKKRGETPVARRVV